MSTTSTVVILFPKSSTLEIEVDRCVEHLHHTSHASEE
jgi:hypothetical protein